MVGVLPLEQGVRRSGRAGEDEIENCRTEEKSGNDDPVRSGEEMNDGVRDGFFQASFVGVISRKVFGCRFRLRPSQIVLRGVALCAALGARGVILPSTSGACTNRDFVLGNSEPVPVVDDNVRTRARSFGRVS